MLILDYKIPPRAGINPQEPLQGPLSITCSKKTVSTGVILIPPPLAKWKTVAFSAQVRLSL